MAGMGIWVVTWILGGAVFLPLLVIALVKLRPVKLAFAVTIAFTIGAMLGFCLGLSIGKWLHLAEDDPAFLLLASAGAIGGAALALSLLRRFAGGSNRRR